MITIRALSGKLEDLLQKDSKNTQLSSNVVQHISDCSQINWHRKLTPLSKREKITGKWKHSRKKITEIKKKLNKDKTVVYVDMEI